MDRVVAYSWPIVAVRYSPTIGCDVNVASLSDSSDEVLDYVDVAELNRVH